MKIPKIALISFIFACIGITTEIIFTAFYDVTSSYLNNSLISWALSGNSYVWMLFIYGLIPFLFKLFNPLVEDKSFIFKTALAVLVIYIVEFVSGFLLKLVLGACPWEYTEGYHIMGLVRLDYLPAWTIFAVSIIFIYQLLDERITD